MKRKKIVILGSTGSIGRQTLDVISAFKDEFEVVGLAAGNNLQLHKEGFFLYHLRGWLIFQVFQALPYQCRIWVLFSVHAR